MNLPNKLTVARVVMIPLYLVLFYMHGIPHNFLWALLVFVIAALTDMLDGKIARSRGLVTDFGKLMDPLADKLLVMAAMLTLVSIELVHAVVVIIVLGREFLVTSIRLVAATKGRVIAADIWGKIKTVLQMVWISYALLLLWLFSVGTMQVALYSEVLVVIYNLLVAAVVALTVLSGANYCWASRDLFKDA